jgi:glycine cleavage system H protein
MPDDRLYDLERDVWLQVHDGGPSATLGVTALLGGFAGRFVAVGFRPVEGRVAAGRSIATIESLRFTGAVRLPVDAEVIERNVALTARPKTLNDAPYGEGWVARLRLQGPIRASDPLAAPAALRAQVQAKIAEWHVRCYPAIPDQELYEIGAECQAVLARLDEVLPLRPPGDVTLLVTDDATSPIEMVRWADRTGHTLLHHRVEGSLHHFLVRREAAPVPRRRRADGTTG